MLKGEDLVLKFTRDVCNFVKTIKVWMFWLKVIFYYSHPL